MLGIHMNSDTNDFQVLSPLSTYSKEFLTFWYLYYIYYQVSFGPFVGKSFVHFVKYITLQVPKP